MRAALRDGAAVRPPCATTVGATATIVLDESRCSPVRDFVRSDHALRELPSRHRRADEVRQQKQRGPGSDHEHSDDARVSARSTNYTRALRRAVLRRTRQHAIGVSRNVKHAASAFRVRPGPLRVLSRCLRQAKSDRSFRRISRVIGACFRRASDLCGRLMRSDCGADDGARSRAGVEARQRPVPARVRISLPPSAFVVSRYVTASAGVVSLVPPHDADPSRV